MAFKLKLPSFGKKKDSSTTTVAPATVIDKTILPSTAKKPEGGHGGVLMLSRFPIAKQLQMLGVVVRYQTRALKRNCRLVSAPTGQRSTTHCE